MEESVCNWEWWVLAGWVQIYTAFAQERPGLCRVQQVAQAVSDLVKENALGAVSLSDLVDKLKKSRGVNSRIRRYPQLRFSLAKRRTSAVISVAIRGRHPVHGRAAVVLLGKQFPMPSQQGCLRDHSRDLFRFSG
jgi:hypothetical protein